MGGNGATDYDTSQFSNLSNQVHGYNGMPPSPAPEQCWCDKQGIGEPGVACGDCPTRDYKDAHGVPVALSGEQIKRAEGVAYMLRDEGDNQAADVIDMLLMHACGVSACGHQSESPADASREPG